MTFSETIESMINGDQLAGISIRSCACLAPKQSACLDHLQPRFDSLPLSSSLNSGSCLNNKMLHTMYRISQAVSKIATQIADTARKNNLHHDRLCSQLLPPFLAYIGGSFRDLWEQSPYVSQGANTLRRCQGNSSLLIPRGHWRTLRVSRSDGCP